MVPSLKGIVTRGIQSGVLGGGGYGICAETRKMRKECLRQSGHLVERSRAEKEHSFSQGAEKSFMMLEH